MKQTVCYVFGVNVDKEKIMRVVIMVVLAVALIVIFAFIYMNYSKGQEFTSSKIEFNELCTQWHYDNCTDYALEILDAKQENSQKATLTEICMKAYYLEDDDKTLKHCKDICVNRCSPRLHYDIAVYPGSIRFVTDNKVEVTLYNLGSGSIYDAYITASTGPTIYKCYREDETEFNCHVDIPSYETETIIINSENPINYIYVKIDYDDANDENNNAEKERV